MSLVINNAAKLLLNLKGNQDTILDILTNLHHSQDQIHLEQLSKAGIIYLGPGCLLRGKDFILYAQGKLKDKLNMKNNVLVPNLDQLNYLFNSSMQFDNLPNATDSNELKEELNKLHKRIEEMKNSQADLGTALSPHDIHL